jgi:solute carrier family 41
LVFALIWLLSEFEVVLYIFLQVVILLLVADWMVHFIWKHGYDPDNIVIPFMTALGDLLGTGLLSLGFLAMWYVGDRDEDVGE